MKRNLKESNRIMQGIFKDYEMHKQALVYYHEWNYYPQGSFHCIQEHSNYSGQYFMHKRMDKMKEFEYYNLIIDQGIEVLDMNLKEIIEKEYIEKIDKDWWMDYYSRATFYRLKHKAIETFLNYISCFIVIRE